MWTIIQKALLSTLTKLSSNNKKYNTFAATGYKHLLLVTCSFLFLLIFSGCFSKPGVRIQKLKNKHYRLIVNGSAYIIKGVCYNPVPIGSNHEHDWWSDKSKPWITDGKLMKEMGVNTIRLYQSHEDPEEVKQVIRDLYNLYGIRTLLGDWLGFWEYPCPFYGDAKFESKVKKNVLEMVNLYKNFVSAKDKLIFSDEYQPPSIWRISRRITSSRVRVLPRKLICSM